MALIPDNNAILLEETDVETTEIEPSKTWAIDFENGRIGGYVDGDLALKQFIKKAYLTERDKWNCYSSNYGTELFTLIGQGLSSAYLDSEIPRICEETILYDDRVEMVTTDFTMYGDRLDIDVEVVPVNGEVVSEGVQLNGI